MPIYMNPKIGDCSSYNSLDCAKDYREGELLDEEDEPWPHPEPPPEETRDYIEAQERYDNHIRLMGESITVWEELYWRRLYYGMKEWIEGALQFVGDLLNGKLIVMGRELTACLMAGGIVLGGILVVLGMIGPVRIKNLGILIVTLIIGSIFATESIEMAASALIGITLLLFIFFSKMTTGNRVLKVKNCSNLKKKPLKNGKEVEDEDVYVFIDFWYMGSRTIWIDLSQKVIGIL